MTGCFMRRPRTAGGITGKSIKLAGASVTTEAGSLVDISGGGDLLAYSWVKGNGGSTDILASSGSFAVIPGYDSNVSPYAPFSSTSWPVATRVMSPAALIPCAVTVPPQADTGPFTVSALATDPPLRLKV